MASAIDFRDDLRILNTLKQWGVLPEKRISELSRLSHRRASHTLEKLRQDRFVTLIDNRQFSRAYRITGSGLDRLDRVRREERASAGSGSPHRPPFRERRFTSGYTHGA